MVNIENGKLQNLTLEDFLGSWRIIPNSKGLSEETVKKSVALAGIDTDVIARVSETEVFVLSKAGDFVRGLTAPNDKPKQL